ncbi:MAG: hypothetical protein HFE85_04195 [Clostridiales bacterium]|nr:hypothetical protein [Clostridiales bacterium]
MADIIQFDPNKGGQPDGKPTSSQPKKDFKAWWKQHKPNKKQAKLIIKILIAVAIVLIGFIWFVNRDRLTPERISEWMNSTFAAMGEGPGYPVSIDGTKAYALEPMGNEVAVLTDTAFEVFNSTAKTVVKEQHGFSHPAMRTTDDRTLIFDRGGTGYRVTAKSGTLFDGKTGDAILCASMGKSGGYAIATRSQEGYVAQIRAYNAKYEEIFKWQSSQQVVDLAVSPDGKKAAAVLLNTKDGALTSTIAVMEFSSGSMVTKEVPDTLLTAAAWCGGRIVAVGDSRCVSINEEGGDFQQASFYEGYLAGYHFSDNAVAVAVSPYEDRRDCVLMLLDANCGELLSEAIGAQVSSLFTDGRRAVVLTEDQVIVAEKDRGIVKTMDATGNFVLERGGKAYVLYGSRIERLDL